MKESAAGGRAPRDGPVARPLVRMVRRPSTVDLIAVELRSAIYSGALPPGSAVREAEVAAQLGVSRGPLREAAQRLVQEGLLVSRPGAGLRVATVGQDEVADLYGARLAIEGHAVRVLAGLDEEARAARVTAVGTSLSALEAAVADGSDARRIGDADLDLHFGLVEATGSRRLTAYASTLIVQTRIAALSQPGGYVVRTDILDVHRHLLDRVSAGDGEAAHAILRDHFGQTADRLRGVLTEPITTVSGTSADPGHSFNQLG